MTEQFKLSNRARNWFLALIGIGVIGILFALLVYPENQHSRLWSNLLLNTYFFTGISLIGMFFVCAHQVAYGGWITAIKRVPEAMSSFIIVAAVFGLIIIIGNDLDWHNLYAHWTHHQDEEAIKGKSALLNKTTWSSINIIFYVLWIALIYFYRKTSIAEDSLTFGANYKKMRAIGAIFLIVFGVSQSIGSWTWVMSLDPHWYSTLFGWYNFASYACAAMAFLALILIYMKSRGYLKYVNENHLHNVGLFMFGFTVFWTYLWFSQFMLQWYANIPEDTAFWLKRWNVGWFKFTFYFVLVINFVIPFLFLLARGAKRNYGRMVVMSIVVICGHYLDFYNMIMFEPNTPEAKTEHVMEGKKESALKPHTAVLLAQAGDAKGDIKAPAMEEGKNTEMKSEGKEESNKAEMKSEGKEEGMKEEKSEAPATYAGMWIPEIFIFLGFIGAFLLVVFNTLSKSSTIPTNDAYLKESLTHHI